jgi:chromatin remodeling complex protein RSC6
MAKRRARKTKSRKSRKSKTRRRKPRKGARRRTTKRRSKLRRKSGRRTKARRRKPRKGARRRTTKRRSKARRKPRRRAKARRGKSRRRPSAAFMKPLKPSAALAAVVGSKALPRTQVTKKLWNYIKRNKLQDRIRRRFINADAKLKAVFGGRRQVNMFQMTKLVSRHLKG